MCGGCCKEVKGWWRSFTATECLLIFLEVILLILLFVCLVFLVLHLVFCGKKTEVTVITRTTVTEPIPTGEPVTDSSAPLLPSKCTWKPSQTTVARTHYYEGDTGGKATTKAGIISYSRGSGSKTTGATWDALSLVRAVSGEASAARHAAALVRGERALCALASVAARWALGAAACVAAAGPRAALRVVGAAGGGPLLGSRAQHAAGLALLRVEPGAALRPARLPDLLDTLTLSLGEHLTLVDYDPRKQAMEQGSVRVDAVAVAARLKCNASGDELLCCACLAERAAPGGAGGLLLRRGRLLGVAAAAPCPHASYIAVAPAAEWIHETMAADTYE